MSALLPTRRRAEAFAAAVDATDAGQAGVDTRLSELLALVGELREVAAEPVHPAADFTVGLRERLMVAAETDLVPTDDRLLLPGSGRRSEPVRRRRLAAVAATAAVLAGTTGVAAASASSLPGDSLYPFKRGVEQAHQAISVGSVAQGRDLLGQADSRLDEVSAMVGGQGDTTALPQTLDDFSRSASRGGELLIASYDSGGDADAVDAVRDFTGTAMGELSALAEQAPAGLQPELARAAAVLVALDQRAARACPDCGARPPLQSPDDLRLVSARSLDVLLGAPDLARAAQAAADRQRRVADDVRPATSSTTGARAGGSGAKGSGGSTGVSGVTADPGRTGVVGRVVGGVVDGVTGSGASSGGGKTGSHGGSVTTGAPVQDPVGSVLGEVGDGVGSVVKGVTGGS